MRKRARRTINRAEGAYKLPQTWRESDLTASVTSADIRHVTT